MPYMPYLQSPETSVSVCIGMIIPSSHIQNLIPEYRTKAQHSFVNDWELHFRQPDELMTVNIDL